MSEPVVWIDCASWELDFFGLPHRIPWPRDVDPADARREPFESEHLLRAIELLGPAAELPWSSFARAATHFEDLAEALEDGEMVRASELLDEMEQLHPGTSFALFHRATIARNEGRTENAIALYKEAAAKTPRSADVWNNLGVTLAFANRRDEAIRAFREALASSPNNRLALEGLAQLRVLVKLLRSADDPDSAVFVDIPTFRKITTEQLGALTGDCDQLVAFGEQLLRDGIVPEIGLQALEKAYELRGSDARTALALAAAYQQSGKLDRAREIVVRLTEEHSNDAAGFLRLAELSQLTNDAAAKKQAIERALAIDPNLQQGLVAKFELTAQEHDPEKERQLVAYGEERGAWMAFLLGSAVARTRGDGKSAVRWAERAVGMNPNSEEALLQYAAALGDVRDMTTLARTIKPQVESGRFTRRLDWHYAHILRHLGLNDDAIRVLRNALRAEGPDDFKAACTTAIDAWSGVLTGCGAPLEVHPSGVLLRPILLTLDGEDGGVLLAAGTGLPAESGFPWRAGGTEAEVELQQGQAGSVREPHRLGIFKVRNVQGTENARSTIECHIKALPDGALHFSAAQNGRRLPVGWMPARTKMR